MTTPQRSLPRRNVRGAGEIRKRPYSYKPYRRQGPINKWLTIGILVFGLGFLSTMIVTGTFAVTDEPPALDELVQDTLDVAKLDSPPSLPVLGLMALAAGALMIGLGLKE
jgi:hypothetical protein